ncbi:twin-arginine translocation signal domain-containing protein [Bradyrhizobium betae]
MKFNRRSFLAGAGVIGAGAFTSYYADWTGGCGSGTAAPADASTY